MGVAKKCVPAASLIIITVFVYFSYSIMVWLSYNSLNEGEMLQKSLIKVYSQIESLRRNHSRFIQRLKRSPRHLDDSILQLLSLLGEHLEEQGPTEEYEGLRRRIYSSTKELWYYVNHQLGRALNERFKQEQRQTILLKVAERKRWLLSDQEKLPALDGYEVWRHLEAASMSDLVQRRLHNLQNPRDCQTGKKIVCNINAAGFGCNIHHLVYCLVVSYASRRTLVLLEGNSDMIYYNNILHPLSDTCTKIENRTIYLVSSEKKKNETALFLPILRYNLGAQPVRPYFIPVDLAQRIIRFSGDPYAWWIGQLVKYILKLRTPDVVDATIARINFTSPVVGVHIRRTDKFFEAEYHDIDEYMSHVADYYEQLELTRPVDQRQVFLATDDVNVLKEAITRYPQYKFYCDYSRAQSADMRSRFTSKGVTSVLVDLYVLSTCDYVVCTFSSNVGRLSYEMMHAKRIDAVNRFTSLDDSYYFTSHETRLRKAVLRHKDVPLEVGDLIKYRCVNASSPGTVWRRDAIGRKPWYMTKIGRIPWYKTEEHLIEFPYPEYKQVPFYSDT